MTLEMGIVLAILVAAVILFVTEKLRIDLVAMLIMSTLLATGILSVSEGIAGFSNTATITVGAMFILSAGLYRTGAVERVAAALTAMAENNFWLALIGVMVIVATVSAFINNTAAVAILLPVVLGVARTAPRTHSVAGPQRAAFPL